MAAWRLLKTYIFWHYSSAIIAWWQIYTNLLWFLFHFFSISILFRTLLAPWRRLAESYPAGFSPQAAAQTLVINSLMRLVGFIIRVIFISSALFIITLAFCLGWFVLALWLIAPFLVLALFFVGFYLVFLT